MTTDDWCTPRWLAELLGRFDLDPCGNERSHIKAETVCILPTLDGLKQNWGRWSVFVNPPYSKPLLWCERLRDHAGPWCALLKLDPSTKWWAVLMAANPTIAPLRKRVSFEGEKSMTANFPSVLIYSSWRPSAELANHLWISRYM